jgi:tRNA pseudouridine38-40 synthase
MKRNIKLVLEYDGSQFLGWQVQSSGRTIQKTLEEVISQIVNHPVRLVCAGRTDTGVHALGQVINFPTESAIPLHNLIRAINSKVNPDIAIISAEVVEDAFNSRHSAKSRWYRYRILNSPVPHVFEARSSYFFPGKLDLTAMQEAGKALLGTHDFTAFNASPELTHNPVRTITHFNLYRQNEFIILDIKANGFFHHMVRSIVGTLIEIGRGKMDYKEMKEIIESRNRKRAGYTAPPQGLFLMEVEY